MYTPILDFHFLKY